MLSDTTELGEKMLFCLYRKWCNGALQATIPGFYSETGFHIGMDRNFVCYGAETTAEVKLSLPFSADNSNLHAIISTSLILNLQ
jgi:hypothetical protein